MDDAIEATQAVIDQLGVVKKAMMAELLTRGLPGRHTRFKQTEIGEMPEDWGVLRLGDLCRVTSGGTPSRERAEFWGGGVPWVKTGEINYAEITRTEETISPAGVANSAAKMVPKGSVLMAMYGQGATRGRVAVLGIDASLNQACLALIPGPRLARHFLYQVLCAKYDELREMGHEGTQKNLNAGLIKSVLLQVPGLDEQQRIAEGLETIDERRRHEGDYVNQLVTAKAALMSVLLSGEVRVVPEEAAE